MKYFPIFLGILLLVCTASAVTWTDATGCWTATDGAYTLVMWNATGTSTWAVPSGVTSAEYLIVAGGGGGGKGDGGNSAGGGAGGLLNGTSLAISGTETIIVGTPGAGATTTGARGGAGVNSSLTNDGATLVAMGGGGGGGNPNFAGGQGGSGGGGFYSGAGGANLSGQGWAGGAGTTSSTYGGGAGGGAGAVGGAGAGASGGAGGRGFSSSITGLYYAGGGGGGHGTSGGIGGSSIGGAGGSGVAGNAAVASTGSGGGGAGVSGGNGGNGSAGVVIVKYTTPVVTDAPIVSFTSNVTSGYMPLGVQFNDTSITSPTAWNWSFTNVTPGNNTQTWWSTTQNATNTFGAGNWKINLNVTNASGYNVSTANYWVNVSAYTLTSNFTANKTTATTGENILFMDNSTGTGTPWTRNWSFGDGTYSTDQDPIHSYSVNGAYDVNLTIYNVSAGYSYLNRTDYITITDSGALSGFNQQDIMMDEIYSLHLTFKDSSTLADIPVVTVTDNYNDTTVTTVGTAFLQYNYSTVIIYAVSSGYYGRSQSYLINRDRVETFYLTQESGVANVSAPVSQIYPKYVTFHLKEGWGTALPDVEITAQGVSTSTGNWDWIVTLLGVPLDEVPINGSVMTQTTDTLGTATFYMIPTGKYNLTFTKAGYTIPSMVLVPQDDDYIIWATGTDSAYFRNGQDELVAVNITVNNIPFNASYNYLNLTYYDSTGHTTGGYIDVLQKNATPGGLPISLAHWHVTNSSFTQSVGVSHPNQISGYVNTNVTHTDFGQIKRSYPFQMNSVPVSFLGFGAEIAMIVALGMMLFTAMLGGATHARQVVFVVVIEAVVFYTMHWFQPLIDRGIPDAAIVLALGLMAVVAIAANMEVRKKREKY